MPRDLVTTLLAAGLAAGLVTSILVPLVLRLAIAARVVDRDDAGSIPRLGGVALFLGVATAGLVAVAAQWPTWSRVLVREQLLALAVGAAIVFLIGVADDLIGTAPWQKLIVQFLAAWLVVSVGWSFESLRLPLIGQVELGVWGPVVSIVWVIGVTNALNLIDGLDGLAGGVATIIALSLLTWALVLGNRGTAILFAAVAGGCLGFLWHNWEPAKIYLGDSGSLTLGFLFGAISLHSSLKAPAAVSILVPILALGLPVIDTVLVMLFRFVRGGGRGVVRRTADVFRADRSHLHHLLGHVVYRRGRIVALLYAVVAAFCAGALVVAFTGELGYGLALLFFEILIVLVMRRMGLAAGAARLAIAQREEARRALASWRPPTGDAETAAEGGLAVNPES